MMSKARLKQRLMDICNGAGISWSEEAYWIFEGEVAASISRAMSAISREFNFPYAELACNMEVMDDMDMLVTWVQKKVRQNVQ